MKIAIGCDHTVLDIKTELISELKQQGHSIIDCGCYTKVRTHYPIYGRTVGLHVAKKECDFGITICGTGIGISCSANKVKGVRAAIVSDVYTAIMAKEKYNANVIACGGRVIGIGSIINIVNEFMGAKYQNKNNFIIDTLNNKIKHLNDKEDLFNNIVKKMRKW